MPHRIICNVNDSCYRLWENYKKSGKMKNNGRALESLLNERTVMFVDIVKQGRKPAFLDVDKLNALLGSVK